LKAPTYTSHRQHIGRTVSHIDRCLGDEIDVRMLADMACFSPYHFLRMFQGLTEETPISMVRRLRLERTRRRLASGISIRQAADEAQFVPEGEEGFTVPGRCCRRARYRKNIGPRSKRSCRSSQTAERPVPAAAGPSQPRIGTQTRPAARFPTPATGDARLRGRIAGSGRGKSGSLRRHSPPPDRELQ
jgi:hypothetical protein